MDAFKKSQTFQNLLKKFNVGEKKRNIDRNAPRKKRNVDEDPPLHESFVRRSSRDVKKPQRFDPSPKVDRSRAFPGTSSMKVPKPINTNRGLETEDDGEFLSASIVVPEPHHSPISHVARGKRNDTRILPEVYDQRESREKSNEGCKGSKWCPQNQTTRQRNELSYFPSSVRQPVVVLNDIRHSIAAQQTLGTREYRWGAPLHDTHSTMRLPDLTGNRNETTMPIASAFLPVQPKRDDGFLRPATPPDPRNLKIISRQEYAHFLEVMEEFANCPYLSAIEIIHFQNKLVEKIKLKIAKSVHQKQINESILKGPICEDNGVNNKEAMVQSWLRSSSSVAHPTEAYVNAKHVAPVYQNVEAKRRKLDTRYQTVREVDARS